jgi:hypothetical protein
MMDFTPEQYRDQYRKLDNLIPHDLAWTSSAAIVIRRGDTFRVHGSGTLMRIGEKSFLVTASHVLESAADSNLQLLVQGTNKMLGLNGTAIVCPGHTIDVAAFELSPGMVETVPPGAFLSWDHVSMSEVSEDALFAVFGFPEFMATFEQEKFKLARFHYMAPEFKGEASSLARIIHRIDRSGDDLVDVRDSDEGHRDFRP